MNNTPRPDTTKTVPAESLMEAFRALRADEGVQNYPPNSRDRKNAIRRALGPIATAYGVTQEALATELARKMDR